MCTRSNADLPPPRLFFRSCLLFLTTCNKLQGDVEDNIHRCRQHAVSALAGTLSLLSHWLSTHSGFRSNLASSKPALTMSSPPVQRMAAPPTDNTKWPCIAMGCTILFFLPICPFTVCWWAYEQDKCAHPPPIVRVISAIREFIHVLCASDRL
jgi:hypothetical protein